MIRFMIISLGFAALALTVFAQESDTLQIESGEGDLQVFTIEVADTTELIERGLMERETLASSAGMLFDFGSPQSTTMWMKNTPLSLDMLFISAEGRVVAIARNTVPQSERRISAGTPVRAVLEINAGLSGNLDIQPGAIVHHVLFGNEIPEEAEATTEVE